MSQQQMMHTVMGPTAILPVPALALTVKKLVEEERAEVMGFLAERPIHTVIMMGMIRDNGLVNELNRGDFFGCRNSEGRLEGVALIGHATLIEARTRPAIRELALVAQFHEHLHMFMAERDVAEQFWNTYADDGLPMRFACRELLFELKHALEDRQNIEGLRLATLDDLMLVAPVHAEMAEEESGVNPLESDRDGFLARCARRISQNRVWVIVKDDQLIFKTDIQAETPEMIYLEGVYAAPKVRGTGLARRSLSRMCSELLQRTRSICVLVNECNDRGHAFYRMCGFKCIAEYDTIFLRSEEPAMIPVFA
ncbi:MAG: GNAT family N-acetyltransferase [Pyrinomonadaceae bacterium]